MSGSLVLWKAIWRTAAFPSHDVVECFQLRPLYLQLITSSLDALQFLAKRRTSERADNEHRLKKL